MVVADRQTAGRDAVAPQCALRIEWPKDLLINGRKVCGILTEPREQRTPLGIGIHVHHQRSDFPLELREKVGSLQCDAGGTWDRAQLLPDVLTHLDGKVMLLRSGGLDTVRREWADACALTGRTIRSGAVSGVVQSIDEFGALMVETPEGTRPLMPGEIELLDGA